MRVRGLEGWGWHSPQPILTHNLLSSDLSVFSPQGCTYCPTPNSFFLQLQFSLISHKLFKEWSCHQGANLGCPSQHGASKSQALNIFSHQTVGAAQSLKWNSQWHQRIPAHKPAMRMVAYTKCFKRMLQYQKCYDECAGRHGKPQTLEPSICHPLLLTSKKKVQLKYFKVGCWLSPRNLKPHLPQKYMITIIILNASLTDCSQIFKKANCPLN